MNRTVIDQAEGLRRMFAADAAHMVAVLGDDEQDITAALAVALSGQGKKVLLLDEALRAGEMHTLLAKPVKYDISSVLRSEKSLQEIVIPTTGVTLLPAGITRSVQNADSARVRLLAAFHALMGMFDIVLIHAAPSALNRPSFGFALAAPEVVVLCRGTSSGITAAYSQVKATTSTPGERHFRLLFQDVDEAMARVLFRNFASVCRQHLASMPDFAGVLPSTKVAAADTLEAFALDMSTWPLPERDDSRFEAFMRRLLSVTGMRRHSTTEY